MTQPQPTGRLPHSLVAHLAKHYYPMASPGVPHTVERAAGDVNYALHGGTYSSYRQTEPRIAAIIHAAVGASRPGYKVVNIGAGAGSYEPTDAHITVTAVEPSVAMRQKRPSHLPAAVDAAAAQLPFADDTFDAAMATFTIHQWPDLSAGLTEVRRVTRGPIVILTCQPEAVERFWLNDYAPEVLATEARRYPSMQAIAAALPTDRLEVTAVPIPLDCVDGFNEAYYGRPERLLDGGARQANSAWSFVDEAVVRRFEERLSSDLQSGRWDEKYGQLRQQATFHGSLVMVVAQPHSEQAQVGH